MSRISARKRPTVFKLDRILKSLLDFCISLLNDPTETDEIQCPFIIAMAVLGVTEKGFHGTDTYPSKMSAILKVSRFFVLRYSYEDTAIADIQIDNENSNSDSDNSDFLELGLGQQKPLKRLTSMVDKFFIRGTNTPIA